MIKIDLYIDLRRQNHFLQKIFHELRKNLFLSNFYTYAKGKKGDEKHEKYEKGREEKERNKLNQWENYKKSAIFKNFAVAAPISAAMLDDIFKF